MIGFVHFASDTADTAQFISLYCIVLLILPQPTKLFLLGIAWEAESLISVPFWYS